MRLIFVCMALLFVFCWADEGIVIDDSPLSDEKYGHSWNLDGVFNGPESTYYDASNNIVFVSNVAGTPTEKDGNGFIQKLSTDGSVIDDNWVSGLNAPKGLRAHEGTLWVSDIDEMVAINIADGTIIKKVAVPNAAFLNDIAIDAEGTVYVSDMQTNKIHTIKGDEVSTLIGGPTVEYPNGLLIEGDLLIVAAWGDRGRKGRLYSLNLKTEEKKLITEAPLGNLDGLELDNDGNYLVSDWMAGKVFKISKAGEVKVLLSGFDGSADLGFIPETNMLLLPRMNENKVTAYDLSKYPNY